MSYSTDTDDLPSMDEFDTGRRDEQIASNLRQQPGYTNFMGFNQTSEYHYQSTSSYVNSIVELDLSERLLTRIPSQYLPDPADSSGASLRTLILRHNDIEVIDDCQLRHFSNLHTLDLSNNRLTEIPKAICELEELTVLNLANNQLTASSFPKSFARLQRLQVLNIGGNRIESIPSVLLQMPKLKALYMGANRLQELPKEIKKMSGLETLYLGGNRLKDIPESIGHLANLFSLTLCENRLESIPHTIAQLQRLESLMLHNNRLTTLPPQIVKLKNLHQLSLRSNPLVAQFVNDMIFEPATLVELAGRAVRQHQIPYRNRDLVPRAVERFLNSANECVNPKCKGVYFTSRVEHVKFVDFCGKYRVPLLEYLCSSGCTNHSDFNSTTASSEYETDEPSTSTGASSQARRRMRKVLLG